MRMRTGKSQRHGVGWAANLNRVGLPIFTLDTAAIHPASVGVVHPWVLVANSQTNPLVFAAHNEFEWHVAQR